jgi:DNA-binding HxlR family transcriptional regulator
MDTITSRRDVWAAPTVDCPTRTIIEVLANKWVLYVLGTLNENAAPMRFNQLGRSIGGITQKMLTQTLRTLERDGLVRRDVYPTVPPRVEYDLTPLGRQIAQLIDAIGDWAFAHVDQILAARDTFDTHESTARQPLGIDHPRGNQRPDRS